MSYCFQWDFCLCKDGRTELCLTMALCFVCYLQSPDFSSKLTPWLQQSWLSTAKHVWPGCLPQHPTALWGAVM